MSSFETEKVITEKFIKDALNDPDVAKYIDQTKKDSQKLILDEISNGKEELLIEDQPEEVEETLPEPSSLQTSQINEEPIENVTTEETESSRDLKITENQESDKLKNIHSDQNGEESEKMEEESISKDEWQDILGSGAILKKNLKEGQPDSRPQRSDKCFINYTCRLEDADEETFVERGENFELGLGEGDVVQGLDVAIGLMNKSERSLLKIASRLAFGTRGQPPNIPGSATVVFDVELVEVQPEDDTETMSVKERRRMGNKKRERGNWWYQRGENTLAIQCYRRALDYLDEVENEHNEEKPTDADLQQLLEDRLKVLNNMASAQIKMELWDQAQLSLQSVLKCQPDNVKALFRKAKIHVAKNDLGQALKQLEKAKSLEPDDPAITKELATVNGLINKQKYSEREYARRMFGGSTSPSGATSKTKMSDDGSKSGGSKLQLWATLGATIIVGLAGVFVYKFRYP